VTVNGDRTVTINELIVGVNIALGATAVAQCPSFDGDHSASVTINELIVAVAHALNGCGVQPAIGVLLSGNPERRAIDATVDIPPSASMRARSRTASS
jgi:hypothetical protein